ncbi:MAG TPA: glycine zipper 2TM domain-containing protein [Burkholderiales bacterium]|nr:glycine zipper 2TM domain-containing protein [Burkholderiales bacterium]
MEANANTRRLHPLVAAAAVSVMVFSAVGVAAITGLIPHSKGDEQPAVTAAATPPAPVPAPSSEAMPAAAPAATPPAPVKKHVAKVHKPATPPAQVAYAETPAYAPPPPPVAQAPQYTEVKPAMKPGVYGMVESVRQVEDKGQANGVGAVGGGVAGAVLGHQLDHGNKLVTVLGAAGGALLGNQIEKTARATKHWELTVRYDDGSTQVFNSPDQPFWHQGDRVRYYEGKLQPV